MAPSSRAVPQHARYYYPSSLLNCPTGSSLRFQRECLRVLPHGLHVQRLRRLRARVGSCSSITTIIPGSCSSAAPWLRRLTAATFCLVTPPCSGYRAGPITARQQWRITRVSAPSPPSTPKAAHFRHVYGHLDRGDAGIRDDLGCSCAERGYADLQDREVVELRDPRTSSPTAPRTRIGRHRRVCTVTRWQPPPIQPAVLDYPAIPGGFNVLTGLKIANETATTRTGTTANPTNTIYYNLKITTDGLLSLSYATDITGNGPGAYQPVLTNLSITGASGGRFPNGRAAEFRALRVRRVHRRREHQCARNPVLQIGTGGAVREFCGRQPEAVGESRIRHVRLLCVL